MLPFFLTWHRKNGTGKRPESLAFEGFPRANPLCPPTPFSKLLTPRVLPRVLSRVLSEKALGEKLLGSTWLYEGTLRVALIWALIGRQKLPG